MFQDFINQLATQVTIKHPEIELFEDEDMGVTVSFQRQRADYTFVASGFPN